MEFNLWSFILDNLESAGAIGGYVSLSIIGFTLISFATKKRHDNVESQIGLSGHILLLALCWEQFLAAGQLL